MLDECNKRILCYVCMKGVWSSVHVMLQEAEKKNVEVWPSIWPHSPCYCIVRYIAIEHVLHCENIIHIPTLCYYFAIPTPLFSFPMLFLLVYIYIYTAIECPALSDLTNGFIVYASDITSLYDFGTTATHSCNKGYSLVGDEIRTCGGDGTSTTGEWDLSEPSCERKLILMQYNFSLLTLFALCMYYIYSLHSYRVSRSV